MKQGNKETEKQGLTKDTMTQCNNSIGYILKGTAKQRESEMSSIQIRVRDELIDKIETTKWEIKYRLRMEIQNTDVLNALIYKYLDKLTTEDVLEYRKKVLKKNE